MIRSCSGDALLFGGLPHQKTRQGPEKASPIGAALLHGMVLMHCCCINLDWKQYASQDLVAAPNQHNIICGVEVSKLWILSFKTFTINYLKTFYSYLFFFVHKQLDWLIMPLFIFIVIAVHITYKRGKSKDCL